MTTKTLPLVTIVALTLAGLFASACDLALIWDGGAQFCYTLFHGKPYAYGARFFSAILGLPVIWAAHLTDELWVLRLLYGLPLCLAPAASAALSWWMVSKTRPALYPWAVLGICVPSVVTQVFVINESIFQQNVFWPVFVGLLVPLDWPRRVVLAGLLIFPFSHPQGLVLLAGAAGILWLLAWRGPAPEAARHRTRALVMTGLAALCLLRVVLLPDAEATRQANLGMLFVLFSQGLAGWPLLGCACVVAAAWMLALKRRPVVFAAGLVAIAGAVWLWWAAEPHRWAKALDARRFVVLLAAPFFMGAWRALIADPWQLYSTPHLHRCAVAVSLILLGTLTLQANGWRALMDRLLAEIESNPREVIRAEDFEWARGTPLDHWALGSQVIARLGGRKLVLDAKGRAAFFQDPPQVMLGYDAPVELKPGAIGWFDFRETVRLGRAREASTAAVMP